MRAGSYVLVAAGAMFLWAAERQRAGSSNVLWPGFWLLTALLLVALAAGRLLDVGQVVTEFGRERARGSGWYGSRRRAQIIVVGAVAGAWLVSVIVAVWRVPERRRRYLPTAIVSATLVCFAAVRLISLHHVDAVLYSRTLAGVRPVLLVEYGLLLLATATLALLRASDVRSRSSTSNTRG